MTMARDVREQKVVDLMAALEQSLVDAKAERAKNPHDVRPYLDADKRARCRVCESRVVGTPAGWFHTRED